MRRYVEWILRHRWLVVISATLVTVGLATQVKNLKIIIDPNKILPQSHPYVVTTNQVERVFGSKYVAVIGVTAKQGDIFQPAILAKVQRVTAGVLGAPGVIKSSLLSLSAHRAKDIVGTADGMEVRSLMSPLPKTAAQLAALKQAIERNPMYFDAIVSRDFKTAAIVAEFKEGKGGFREIMDYLDPLMAKERDPSVEVIIGGNPPYLAPIEVFSERVAILFPLALLLVGLIHFEAFRTAQGLILPLVTAVFAVLWAVGMMGVFGQPIDTFNAATPVLILAVAAGHAVQLLKRYYEEYQRIRDEDALTPRAANDQAIVDSVTKVGPVMLTAGGIAAAGFLSLMIFDISSVRTFGVFTGAGIVSALILEMTFIPALRSLLPPPSERERARERSLTYWDRVTLKIADWVLGRERKFIYAGAIAILAVALIGTWRVEINNTTKSYFSPDLPFLLDDEKLNQRLAGTATLHILVEGEGTDAIKDPAVMQAMDALQRYTEQQPYVGKTLSLVDFVKRMNQAMNGDASSEYRVPESRELIAQYLLLYSMSGDPGDFDSYIDYDYRLANIVVFFRTDSSVYQKELLATLQKFAERRFPPNVKVRMGGGVTQGVALNDVLVRSKILNIVQIAGVVYLVSALVFRSLLAGVLVLVPLLFAVMINFGVMGWTGMWLNIPTSLSSAMAVGIGADYAIYLLYRFREEFARVGPKKRVVREVLRTAGKASLFVATAVAGGYSVMFFSFGFRPHQWLATLICLAMIVSVFAALTLIPSLILSLKPRFIFDAAVAAVSGGPRGRGPQQRGEPQRERAEERVRLAGFDLEGSE